MNVTLLLGLLLQVVAVLIVLAYVRSRWLVSCGVLFVTVAFLYHGLSEIVQRVFPGHNEFRDLVAQNAVDVWTVLAGAAMLCFAACYCITLYLLRSRRRRTHESPLVSRVPGWVVLLILSVVSRLIVLSGQDLGYWVMSFAAYLGDLLLVLGCAGFVLRKGPAFVLPTVIGSSLFLAMGGARFSVVLNFVLLVSVLKRLSMPVRLSRLVIPGAVVLAVVILISAARVTSGRLGTKDDDSGLVDRLRWLSSGSQIIGTGQDSLVRLAEDFSYRFDGNAFPALVLEDFRLRQTTPGLTSFWRNFVLMIPSALVPGKAELDPRMLYEEDYSITFFRLPEDVDYMPMTLGILFTYHAVLGLILYSLMLGVIYGLVDHVAMRPRSLVALLLGITFSWTALLMEQGIMVYFGTMRTVVIYLVVVWIIWLISRLTRPFVRALWFDLKLSTP
jgi:hypothetical protein